MDDDQILERGGTEEDIIKYADQNGANLVKEDIKADWEKDFDNQFLMCPNCGGYECEYSGDDKCFHGTENETKTFIKSLLFRQKEELEAKMRTIIDDALLYADCTCNEGGLTSVGIVEARKTLEERYGLSENGGDDVPFIKSYSKPGCMQPSETLQGEWVDGKFLKRPKLILKENNYESRR